MTRTSSPQFLVDGQDSTSEGMPARIDREIAVEERGFTSGWQKLDKIEIV
jgi:hypothetical protein